MDIFIIKKLAGNLLMPLPVSILLLFWGLICLLRDRKTKGLVLSILGLTILTLFSTPWLPNMLLVDLEQKYKQFDVSQKVDAIVVLGCGHTNDGSLPITAQLHTCSLARVTEAVRLYRHNLHSHIITSGYGGNEPFSNAEMNKKLAVALGVPPSRIKTFPDPRDTQQEALALSPHLLGKRFALVTSASHMPRAMQLFDDQGLLAIAAPTQHLSKDISRLPWWKKRPGSQYLGQSEVLWYELMGQSWLKLKNWLSSSAS